MVGIVQAVASAPENLRMPAYILIGGLQEETWAWMNDFLGPGSLLGSPQATVVHHGGHGSTANKVQSPVYSELSRAMEMPFVFLDIIARVALLASH